MFSDRASIMVPARGCKYISGDPKFGGWSYCGNKLVAPNSSWCAEHHAVVYQFPKPKPEAKSGPKAKQAIEITPQQISLEDPMLLS